MTQHNDLTIPLSALAFKGDGKACAKAGSWDTTQIGALLQHVVTQAASQPLDKAKLFTVSVTYDVSAAAVSGGEIQFESRIDRRTRTLVFASGIARQDDRVLIKATIIFRIA